MRQQHPDFVNRFNGSSIPFRGGGLHMGKIVAVGKGNTVTVSIPGLGVNVANVVALDTTKAKRFLKGDSVICAFLANDNQELVIIGRMNIASDVFATKVELTEAISTLNATISALNARVAALETHNH
jgi:hypothetical protein